MKTALFLAFAALALSGCAADRYNRERTYSQLSVESEMSAGAEEFDPVMARRQPEVWAKKRVGLFGVVLQREDEPGDKATLTVQVRTLEPRNLCMNQSASSCRTTISENGYDKIRVRLTMNAREDITGETSIGPGSLLRLFGRIVKNDEQGLVFDADYYRHWPRGYYVTTASQSMMRK